MQEDVRVRAINISTGQVVGDYDSCCQAAKKLFIRKSSSPLKYVQRKTGRRTGVKSYKTGIRYHFEKIL